MDLTEFGDTGSGCEDKDCDFLRNCSNRDCQWEEPMFGLTELVCVTVIYIPLMLFGLLGNILTILVVWLRPHMRSSTYLYLSSMAVSDLLILLLLPLDLYKLWRPRPWPLGDLACKFTMFLSECCTFCTILHITFLSLERYLAICWPITAKTLVTRRRTRALIGCLWLGAAISAAPVLIMVGVEEVGREELGLVGWREDGGDGEQGGFVMGDGERGGGLMRSMVGGPEGRKWEERETEEWSERAGELKWFGEKGERKLKETDEKKQVDEEETKDEKQADEGGGEEEGETEADGKRQNKMKEDEGGGREEDGDERECRCTQYAVSSGLLSAMMILSNLYFLVPLGILGLVYSLIGRTLWLRPQSSRKDQSHRHTVKMLGVIVLAFVLCWLPFHVGRTIFSLSLGSGADAQETDPSSHLDTTRDISAHAVTAARSESDAHFSGPAEMTSEVSCVTCADDRVNKINTSSDVHTHSDDMSSHKRLHSHALSHDGGQRTNASTHNLEKQNVNRQLGKFADSRHTNNQLHNAQNDTHSHTPHTAPSNANDTALFDDAYAHPDAHLYFLYYLSQYFNLVSSVLFYLSAAVNPLLYNLMSARYRHAVHSLVRAQPRAQSGRLRTTTLAARHSTTTL